MSKLIEPAVMFASSTLHAVWWVPHRDKRGRLMVANTTDETVNVSVKIQRTAPG